MCEVAGVLPESQAEGETVHKALEEPADAINARIRLLLLQVSVELVQFGHQDLTQTLLVRNFGLGLGYFFKKNLKGFQLGEGGKIESFHVYLLHREQLVEGVKGVLITVDVHQK